MQNQKAKRQNTKRLDKNSSHSDSRRPQQGDGNSNDLWLCGKHPILTILQKKRRKIFEILVTKNTVSELENFLKKNSLHNLLSLVKIVDDGKIESLVGKYQVHQGFAIRASKLTTKNQDNLLEELSSLADSDNLPTLMLLDQISDPHNVGAIIRSAASFGVKKIIFSEHNSPRENATIVKSSAGAIELVDLIIVTNFSNLLAKLKKIGYWCVGLDSAATTNLTKIKDYKNIALIIGSEGSGMRELVKKNCDILAKIEIDEEVESLNASVAASIALYELLRK